MSSGEDALDLADSIGLVAMPWQRYVMTHALGERDDGTWAAKDVSVWVPRQNGKGTLIEIRVLAGLFLFGERLILWSAHEYKTAQEGFLRIKELIQNAPDLDRLVARYWQANGEQGIELKNGQRLRFVARSGGSGRGFTGDTIILDEAQFLQLAQMKALYPTLAARPNPQVWFLGTPPEDPAAWVYGLRKRGEDGAPRMAHFDWGIELDLEDPDLMQTLSDRDLWYRANPSLGYLLGEENCQDELQALREGFAPERLGVWLPRARTSAGVIPDELWRDLVEAKPRRPREVVFAVKVNSKRSYSTIVSVGRRADDTLLVSIVAHQPGTHWVADRLAELKARHNPLFIVAQDKGPTGVLLAELKQVGIVPAADRSQPKRGDLVVPWASDLAVAYGLFVDAVTQRRLFHLDEAPLNLALQNADTRPLSGGTAWTFDDPTTGPLLAATEGVWAALTLQPAQRRRSAYEADDLVIA